VKRHRLGDGVALALAVADFDGDGHAELAVLRREAVELWSRRSGHWRRGQRVALTGRLASQRPRRPMGTLLAADLDGDSRPELYQRSSDIARGGTFRWKKKKLMVGAALAGYPAFVFKGKRVDLQGAAGMDFFQGGSLWPKIVPKRLYGLKLARVARRGPANFYAAAVDLQGTLHLFDVASSSPVTTLAGVGAAFALLDADDDGQLELLVSAADETGQEERVRVFRLTAKKLQPMWRSTILAGRVSAFGHGDMDGDGRMELMAATVDEEGRCWLLQLD
ncbi:MAG: VCBS repeat-containing protein, partial [Deltaproteobacteria bacterium]|nr:VCBS repeat-containing protein [Deltaproteobacteria bacterium]